METLVQLIFIIAIVKYTLKAALGGNPWMVVGYAAAAAALSFALYPLVIEQPLTVISQMLDHNSTVENIALITTAEAIVGVLISVYLIDNYFKPKIKRTKLAFALKIVPGALVFCAIGYFELLFFKFRAGHDFLATAILYAAMLFVAISALSFLIRRTLQGESLKLEVKVILNLAILIIGLLISCSVADYNSSNAHAEVEWRALISLAITATSLFALGVWLQRTNIKTIFKKQQ